MTVRVAVEQINKNSTSSEGGGRSSAGCISRVTDTDSGYGCDDSRTSVILAPTLGLYHVDFERYGSVIPNRYGAVQSDDDIHKTVSGSLTNHTDIHYTTSSVMLGQFGVTEPYVWIQPDTGVRRLGYS